MSIFDVLKDRESSKTFEEANAAAIKIFDQQKQSIKDIASSEGFKTIKKFWESEREIALQRMVTSKKNDEKAKAMFSLADSFLKFLDSRST